MLYFNTNDVSESIGAIKANTSKKCIIFHSWVFR